MEFIYKALSIIYTALYCSGIKLPKPEFLFNKPFKKLDCKFEATILADKSFTDNEKILILEALDDLHYFCNGLVEIEIIFELDVNNSDQMDFERYLLLKAPSTHDDIKFIDTKYNMTAIGLCHYLDSNFCRLYLVFDRLNSPSLFKTTAIHELGHFIGLQHTDKKSIMHKINRNNVAYPTIIDAKETSSAWNVNYKFLRYFT